MQTVSYKSVVDLISGYLGENAGMSAEDHGNANRLINTRYKGAFEYYFWPELMLIEQRQFRPSYDNTATYAAGTATAAVEVYYPRAQKYYQALQPTTGNAPATGTDLTVNAAFWAESQPCYSADDWATGRVLNVGDQVRNPDDQRYYQTTTAHTAGVSFDPTQFGILTAFVRSIDYTQAGQTVLGSVKQIWDRNPDTEPNARPVQKVLRAGSVIVRGCQPVVWVEFRTRPVSFSGPNWTAGSWPTYSQCYYDTTGEYYRAIAPATSEPPTDTGKWVKLDFPYIFQEYVAQSVYAAMVSHEDEMPEDFSLEATAGYPLLVAELMKIERQQGQTRPLNVVNTRSI